MHDKEKDKKSFRELSKNLLSGYFYWQYCQEPYLEPKQKSMVELFCKNSWQLLAANSFLEKNTITVRLCCLQRKRNNSYIILYTFT